MYLRSFTFIHAKLLCYIHKIACTREMEVCIDIYIYMSTFYLCWTTLNTDRRLKAPSIKQQQISFLLNLRLQKNEVSTITHWYVPTYSNSNANVEKAVYQYSKHRASFKRFERLQTFFATYLSTLNDSS